MSKSEKERYNELWFLHMQGYPLTHEEIQEYEVLSLKHTIKTVLSVLFHVKGESHSVESVYNKMTGN